MFKKTSIEKIRKVEKVSLLRRISWKFHFSYAKILRYLLYGACVGGFVFITRFFIYGPYFRISQVRFDETSIDAFHNIDLYTLINKTILQKNYLQVLLFHRHGILKTIKDRFPSIQSIEYHRLSSNTILINLNIDAPKIIYSLGNDDLLIASYQEQFYEVHREDSLLSGRVIFLLPEYIADEDTIQGIYSRFPESRLSQVVAMIQEVIPAYTIKTYTFIPGNTLLLLDMESGHELLFSLTKDINPQLIKRLDIQQYYPAYTQFHSLDLGSSEHTIVR